MPEVQKGAEPKTLAAKITTLSDSDREFLAKGAQSYLQEKEANKTPPPLSAGPILTTDEKNALLPSSPRRFSRRRILRGMGKAAAIAVGGTALFEAGRLYQALQQIPSAGAVSKPEASVKVEGQPPAAESKPSPAEEALDLFTETMTPFKNEAFKGRSEREKSDPEYSHRINKELNDGRINFLLFITGTNYEHEPPANRIGDYQILSYNLKTNTIDLVTVTHDTRAPEIERHRIKNGKTTQAERIDKAYEEGGFSLMRQTVEDATGLSMDFQIAAEDVVIKDLVDFVFGGLNVEIPYDITTEKFYIGNKEYPVSDFKKGPQRLDGLNVMRFIKARDRTGDWQHEYVKERERHPRQHIVLEAVMKAVSENINNNGFRAKTAAWLGKNNFLGKFGNKDIAADFSLAQMGFNDVSILTKPRPATPEGILPKIGKKLFIVDISSGDGGVNWVNIGKGATQEEQKRNLAKEGYGDIYMEIPTGGNPDAPDLVKDYWFSTRKIIKDTLTKSPVVSKTNLPMP